MPSRIDERPAGVPPPSGGNGSMRSSVAMITRNVAASIQYAEATLTLAIRMPAADGPATRPTCMTIWFRAAAAEN